MKIFMLNPPFLPKYSRSSRSPAVTKSGTIYYPLWLSYATGLLEKHGHEVLLLDAPAEGLSIDDVIARAKTFNPGMLVCDTSTPSIAQDVASLDRLSDALNGLRLRMLVGTHPSALPEETMALSRNIDAIARREYDSTLLEIANGLDAGQTELGSVAGISYRFGDRVVSNPDRAYIEDMDSIPFVSEVYKRHLNIKNYFYAHVRNPTISIFGGRGCPNRCFFCVYPQVMFGHRYRHRSALNLVQEMEYIKRQFPEVREVLIDDDNFTVDQEHVIEFCRLMVERRVKVAWTVEARVNLRLDTMRMMKKAGCRLLVAGFESGNQAVLDAVTKGITLDQSIDFCTNAKRAGLRVHGCFMVGNKGDTRETIEETIRFAIKLNPDTAQFFPLMVYPGTEAYAWAKNAGFLKTEDFRAWLSETGMHNCVIKNGDMDSRDLVEFCDQARRRFYLRPRYFIRKILDVILHPTELRRTVRAALSLVKHLRGTR